MFDSIHSLWLVLVVEGGNRTFAAVSTEVCYAGLSELSPQVRQWPLSVGVSSKQPECIYAISSIMYVMKSGVPSTKAAQ